MLQRAKASLRPRPAPPAPPDPSVDGKDVAGVYVPVADLGLLGVGDEGRGCWLRSRVLELARAFGAEPSKRLQARLALVTNY